LVAGLVFLAVREPQRGGFDPPALADKAVTAKAGFAETVKMFFTTPALLLAAVASGVTQIITYGSGNFSTLILMREKGMSLGEVALWVALVVAVFMSGGIFVSGRVIDRFTRRSRQAYALVPAVSLVAAAPLFLGFTLAARWPTALLFLAGVTSLNYFYLSSAVALVQQTVRPDQRVLCGALLLLVMNLMGLGLGPTFVGAMSDHFHAAHPHTSLQLAFLCLLPFYGIAILLFLALARVLKREETH
jgi:MFS family permease